MKLLPYLFIFSVLNYSAQSIQECKNRFNSYLNFRNSLKNRVVFSEDALYLTNAAGKKDFAVYSTELKSLANFFEHSSMQEQINLIQKKGLKKFTALQCDSLTKRLKLADKNQKKSGDKALAGYRIALEAGHFSTNLKDAASEQKYLHFETVNEKGEKDSVLLFESQLTFNTVHILKQQLMEQGAEVFITRSRADFTSFECTFPDWIKYHRKRTLDSLVAEGKLSLQKHKFLLKCNNYDLFWEFFRDFDLGNRAAKINAFKPDVTLIVHYNVDEKNAPWKKNTQKDFTMAFIGGGYTSDNLNKPEGKANFIRQLISDQLNQSEQLSAKTVGNFNKSLNIPIAKASDAEYLRDNCLSTKSAGVFCRNLVLCRKINSPLVYGESLYQDNVQESKLLMKNDLEIYGIKANARIKQVADAYFDAVVSFLAERPLRH